MLPSWVTGGLSVAGKLLPGLGIAMLLHYMPAKKYFNYILIGFVLSAYMGVPILGIAFLGVALAYKFYMDEEAKENVGFAGGLEVGAHLQVSGRVQSREYTKKIGEEEVERRVAYEVSVSKIDLVEDEE